MTAANVLGLVGAITILLTLFEMLRRHRLREKYAADLVRDRVVHAPGRAVPGTAQPGHRRSSALQVPSNLLFFVASVVLLVLSLQHSYELGRLEERTRTLAEEVALLRLELEAGSRGRRVTPSRRAAPRGPRAT